MWLTSLGDGTGWPGQRANSAITASSFGGRCTSVPSIDTRQERGSKQKEPDASTGGWLASTAISTALATSRASTGGSTQATRVRTPAYGARTSGTATSTVG